MKGLNYDVKILLAWGESIDGNDKITQWLIKNGYPELGLFRYALRNEERSRTWLMQHGHPHLMALINGIEGKESAIKWLEDNQYLILKDMALAGDGDAQAYERLMTPALKVFALLAKKMEFIKDEIEDRKNDFHRFSSDL